MKRMKSFFSQLWNTFRRALKIFIAEKYARFSASLSYYAIFSLAPLLIIAISLSGYFFGKQAMEGKIYAEMRNIVGDVGARQIQQMIQHAALAQDSLFARIFGFAFIVIGILIVFMEVQDAINSIWGLKAIPRLDKKKYLFKRVLSLGIFSIIGFIFVLSVIISWLIDYMGNYLAELFAGASFFMVTVINRIFIIAIVALMLTFIFKYLPDGKVNWRDVIKGAIFTSVLFVLGQIGISYFLSRFLVTSTYGAAGSLVVLLLWIYYSSFIIYFGVTFTKVYANTYGNKIIPGSFAVYENTRER